jgi:endonuclease YncB( thermonuclease family)
MFGGFSWQVKMRNLIIASVVVGIFLGGSAAFVAQKKPLELKLSGDPRCAQLVGVDSCTITLYRGTITDVIDGQTLSVTLKPFVDGSPNSNQNEPNANTKTRLRLAGISAPRLDDPLGRIAKNNLARLLLRKEVRVQFFCSSKNATVTNSQTDAGLEQIKAGLARYDESQADAQEYTRCNYRFAEEKAKIEGVGIWALKK